MSFNDHIKFSLMALVVMLIRLLFVLLFFVSSTPAQPFFFFAILCPLASACEFADIVELLLKAGADPSIKDTEGSLPEEVTECGAISSILRQYTVPKG